MAAKKDNKSNTRSGSIPHAKNILAASLLFALVFALVFFWPSPGSQKNNQSVSGASGAASEHSIKVRCDSPDQSFCPTQVKFSGWITRGYFSNVMEAQRQMHITCANSAISTNVCAGTPAGTVVSVYPVIINGTAHYFSRNDYNSYFAGFAKSYAPFKFNADKKTGGDIEMEFSSTIASTKYSLKFTNNGSVWVLRTVSIH